MIQSLYKTFIIRAIAYLESHPVLKDLFLYYIKGIEDGPRIEKRMYKAQQAFEKWCAAQGIALVALKKEDGSIALSFVPEQAWEQGRKDYLKKQMEDPKNLEQMLKPFGDKINENPQSTTA